MLGELAGDPVGLGLGDLDGDLLGDAFVLLPPARGLVARGTAALVPVRLGALADPVPGDGRAAGFVALADDELTGGGSFDDAVRNVLAFRGRPNPIRASRTPSCLLCPVP